MNLKEAIYEGLQILQVDKDIAFQASRKNVQADVIYVTELSSCPRKWVLEAISHKNSGPALSVFDSKTLLIFADGNATEDTLVKAIGSSPLKLLNVQASVTMQLSGTSYMIRGRTDATVDFADNGGHKPIEIKSMNSRNFAMALNFGPKSAHVNQLSFYIHASKASGGHLLYKEKNSGEMQEFYISDVQAQEHMDRILPLWTQAVQDFGSINPLPLAGMQRADITSPDECAYCNHKVSCNKATRGETLTVMTQEDVRAPWI